MDWHEYITADPAILVGKPIILGTRISVELILDLVSQGWQIGDITRNYLLTTEQVRACFAFALDRVHDEKIFATVT